MDPILTASGAIAGKTIFTELVKDLYSSIVKFSGRKIKQWNTERKIDTLYRKINVVRKVKTIWQVDKAVDLITFYCDSNVIVDEERKTIQRLNDLPPNENILIEGIAGQGKSIFLRYLCSVELAHGDFIPVFIELRSIHKGHSLRDRIFAAFKAIGLSLDDKLFGALAVSGKIILFLDAFDEIPEDIKGSVLTEIEDLVTSFDKLRVIVSSRPDQGIQSSNHFRTVHLDNLEKDEYMYVIKKLSNKERWAESLINHIEEGAKHIKELLCTPLMVTLLVLLYKSYNKLPANLSEFYDNLFQTLLQRHDGTKPGFVRQRRCDLDDTQYRSVFETMCILAKKMNKHAFNEKSIYQITKRALEQCFFVVNPNSYIEDIVKITCLILKEGQEFRFIHKTVQEYYTSSYIVRKPESWAQQFYTKIIDKCAHREWLTELAFLSEIDRIRYNRYYLLPSMLSFLGITEDELTSGLNSPNYNQMKEHLKKILFCMAKNESHCYWGLGNFFYQEFATSLSHNLHMMENRPTCKIKFENRARISSKDTQKRLEEIIIYDSDMMNRMLDSGGDIFTGMDVYRHPGKNKKLVDSAKKYYLSIFEEARSIIAVMRQDEDVSLLDGLV